MRSTLSLYVILGLITGYVFLRGPIKSPVQAQAKEIKENGSTFEAITGESAEEGHQVWDTFYKEKSYAFGKEPVSFLKDHIEMIPVGKAYVPAMGEGRNAIFLAKRGFKVDANELSEVAIDNALVEAKAQHVAIHTSIVDFKTYHFPKNEYDFVLVSIFYDKNLNKHFKEAVKKGGYIMYYSHVKNTDPHAKKDSPNDYSIRAQELKEQFKDFHIVLFQEYIDHGIKVVGMLARKP